MMKKRNIISLIFLFVSTQIYGSTTANPALAFVIACQAADSLYNTAEETYDTEIAAQIIDFINQCILIDKNLQQELAASVNGYLFKGKPLDPKAIAAQNAQLQKDIKNYDQNIKKLKGSNNTMSVAHKEKIKNRQENRKKQQQKLQQNITALQANQKAENDAQTQANIVKNLIEQNQLSVDQAIEYYIATFGQCYTQAGSIYGSTTVISSRQNKNTPITPAVYNDFIQSLNQAANQFGTTISISLALNDGVVEVSIKDVASYVANKAPSSTSYTTYALVGLGITAATVAALAANNIAQGRDWYDTTVYADLANQSYSSSMKSAQNLYDSAYVAVTRTLEDGTAASTASLAAASSYLSSFGNNSVVNNMATSFQNVLSYFNSPNTNSSANNVTASTDNVNNQNNEFNWNAEFQESFNTPNKTPDTTDWDSAINNNNNNISSTNNSLYNSYIRAGGN